MIFNAVDIISIKDGVGITANGGVYELVSPFDVEVLLLHALGMQLKITSPEIGYTKVEGKLYLVQALDDPIEYWDDSVRFQLGAKSLINVKDLILYSKLLEMSGRGVGIENLAIKFGKKHELYFPFIETSKTKRDEITLKLDHYYRTFTSQQVVDLEQRFWILLNHSYLNKLKTYFAFWLKDQNVIFELPDWLDQLFTEDK